jgi:DNA-binding NtrC family response regulator
MPARKASGAAVVESVVPTPVVSRTPTILLVDDDESVRVTMQAVLEMDGYRVTPVSKGSDALELLAEREFDLVLTDLRLDDLDGIAILEEIKQRWPDTVAVLLTGYASLESAVKALRQGAYDYLFKPTDVEELRATVARGIEKRQLTQALRLRVAELERATRSPASTARRSATSSSSRSSAGSSRSSSPWPRTS